MSGANASAATAGQLPFEGVNVAHALGLGIGFLKSKLAQDACFLRVVASNGARCPTDNAGHLFAAFFLCEGIAEDLCTEERARILSRIDCEERDGAWGYAPCAPVDSDDTAFALRTAARLGRSVDAAGLRRFARQGIHTTFLSNPTRPARLVDEPSVEHNLEAHPEVLANIYTLFAEAGQERDIVDVHIRAAQREDGSFRSYFYPSPYYSTWMFMRLIGNFGRWKAVTARAVDFLRYTQNPNGSWGNPGNAYETALALSSLATVGLDCITAESAARFLTDQQDNDGSWYTPKTIWAFCNSDFEEECYDANRVVTTSLAVLALKAVGESSRVAATGNSSHSVARQPSPGVGHSQADRPVEDDTVNPVTWPDELPETALSKARQLGVGATISEVQATASSFRARFGLQDPVELNRWMASAGFDSRIFLELMFEQTLADKVKGRVQECTLRVSDRLMGLHNTAVAWQTERQARLPTLPTTGYS